MNERPGVNLGVIEDMESTLHPDNHTVKARGVWLMDGVRAACFSAREQAFRSIYEL